MRKYDTDYKELLLWYFLYIWIIKGPDVSLTENLLLKEFNKFMTTHIDAKEFRYSGSLGKGRAKQKLRKLTEAGYIDEHYNIIKYPSESFFEDYVDERHRREVYEYFNIAYTSEEILRYPFPDINAPFDTKTYFWYYRSDRFVKHFQKFKENFLNNPWDFHFGLIYGDSNSGKTSFLQFLQDINDPKKRSEFSKNDWVIEHNNEFDFSSNISLQIAPKIIDTVDSLNTWLKRLISNITRSKENIDNNNPHFDLVSKYQYPLGDYSTYTKLLAELLERKGKKQILVLDQSEALIDELLKNNSLGKEFIEKLISEMNTYKNLAILFVVSSEYRNKFEDVFYQSGNHFDDFKKKTFRIPPLEITLIEQILSSLNRVEYNYPENYYKIHFPNESISVIKDAVSDINITERFTGSILLILLHGLVEKYQGTEELIQIPATLTKKECLSIISKWSKNRILKRYQARKNTASFLEFTILNELYTKSPNIISPINHKELQRKFTSYKTLYDINDLSYQKALKNLAKDDLIDYSEDCVQIKHQFILEKISENLTINEHEIVRLKRLINADFDYKDIPSFDILQETLTNIDLLVIEFEDPNKLRKLTSGIRHHIDKLNMTKFQLNPSFIQKLLKEHLLLVKDGAIFPSKDREYLLALFKQNKRIIQDFFSNEQVKDMMIEEWTWEDLLNTEYSSTDVVGLLRSIQEINENLMNSICTRLFSIIDKSSPEHIIHHLSTLKLLNEIGNHLIEPQNIVNSINEENWKNVELNTIQKLLSLGCQMFDEIIENYGSSVERHQYNGFTERKQVESTFVFAFVQKVTETIDWKNISWSDYDFTTIDQLIGLFEHRYLAFPVSILEYDWHELLKNWWHQSYDCILEFLARNRKFQHTYFESWTPHEDFPTLKEFVSIKKLSVLNFFLSQIINAFSQKEILYDFINSPKFKYTILEPLLSRANFVELEYFLINLEKISTKKFTIFSAKIRQFLENRFFNNYHKTLSNLFKEINSLNCKTSAEFYTESNFTHEPTWYWSMFSLPSLLDIVMVFEFYKSDELRRVQLAQDISDSIAINTKEWNNLLSKTFYLESLQQFYPGTVNTNFLTSIPSYQETPLISTELINIIHQLTLYRWFEILSTIPAYFPVLTELVKKTDFLSQVFDPPFIKKYDFYLDNHSIVNYRNILLAKDELDFNFLNGFFQSLFGGIIAQDHEQNIIYSFFKLLNSNYENIKSIWSNFQVHSNLVTNLRKRYSISQFPNWTVTLFVKLFSNKPKPNFTEQEKVWIEVFDLNLSKKGVDYMALLNKLKTHPQLIEIIEQISWKSILPKLDHKQLEQLVLLLESERQFFSKDGYLIISFAQGLINIISELLAILPSISTFNIALDKWNYLYELGTKIKNKKIQNIWITTLNKYIKLERTEKILSPPAEEDNNIPQIRYVIDFLDILREFDSTEFIIHDILNEISLNKALQSKYFLAFTDVFQFIEYLQSIEEQYPESTIDYYSKLFESWSKLDLSFENRYLSIPKLLEQMKLVLVEREDIQNFIIEQKLFDQIIKHYASNKIKLKDCLQELHAIFSILNQEASIKLFPINSNEYLDKLLQAVMMNNKLEISSKNIYDYIWVLKELTSNEFLDKLLSSNLLDKIDWKLTKYLKKSRYPYELIRNLKQLQPQLQQYFLAEKEFWDFNWMKIIKKLLLYKSKDLVDVLKIFNVHHEIPIIQQFLMSKEFLKLPWIHLDEILVKTKIDKKDIDVLYELLEKNSAFDQ